MLSFDSLAYVTLSNKGAYLPFHAMPPESCLEVLVHLGSSRMDVIWSVMSFLQDQVLELFFVGYADAIPEPYDSLSIH